eukprot:CAMPEP_0117776388 /NCGR_PEP_ID=MMETSP0947-20121206/27719_1 /TAXON_ID=44440 /ORGANISM="Chattonella subsalsa, Strain CCMP2191" /LENGTH=602 /DNA_ID=CAMNT_0005603307 /DNA_START=45 /DNA_END=1856 /DNA_ORIENTATION=+
MKANPNREGIIMGVLGTTCVITGAAAFFSFLRQRKLSSIQAGVVHQSEFFLEASEELDEGSARDLRKVPHHNSTIDLLAAADEEEKAKKGTGNLFASPEPPSRSRTGSLSNWRHPDGKNIGRNSNASWFRGSKENNEAAAKTDLMHTGHIKGGKLVLCMVGLPGRGKSFIARKVARYLRWINYRTRVFSIARFRLEKLGSKQPAEFFDPENEENIHQREEILKDTLEAMMMYLNRGGEVAILDGTNYTWDRRELIRERVMKEDGYEVMWIESIATDSKFIDRSITSMKDSSPDFIERTDFLKRVTMYEAAYETLQEEEGAWVKVFNGGKRLEINKFNGFLPTKITSFVMNLQVEARPIFLSRHGESQFNVKGLIGGDSSLSNLGEKYAERLAEWVSNCPELPADLLSVWTSTMKRTRQTARNIVCDKKVTSTMKRTRLTARNIVCDKKVEWRALREIEVGVCDGLTYNQVKELFPEEYRAREEDKLRYRYPRGESYLDIINRLEPVLFEIERQTDPLLIVGHQAIHRCIYAYFLDLPPETDPLLIVGHQAIHRCIYAYFLDLPPEEIPYLSIPLHTVIKLMPKAFGCTEKRFKLLDGAKHSH